MANLFSDPFTGSLNATNWLDEASPTVWSTSSNELACSTANFRVLKTTTAAHAAIANGRVRFKRTSATFDGAVLVRCSVNGATSVLGDAYLVNPFGTQVDVIRRLAGVNSTLSGGLTGITYANGDYIDVVYQGTGATVTFDIYKNTSIFLGQIADSGASRILVAGQTGFVTFSTSSRFAEYSVDDLSGGGPGLLLANRGGMTGGMAGMGGGMR